MPTQPTTRRNALKTGALLSPLAAAGSVGALASTPRRAVLDDILKRGVETGVAPGAVGMLTTGEATIYQGFFGERAKGLAMSPDTIFSIASITKGMVSTAVLQAVERGVLDLDSPAGRWAPALHEVKLLEGFDAAGQPLLRKPSRPITLRDLLSHTSGFGYEYWSPDIIRYQKQTGMPAIGTHKAAALRLPILHEPGTRWTYGIGLDWAAQVLEGATGRTLGTLLQEGIFEPLGMTSASHTRITAAMRSRLAKVHVRDGAGRWQQTEIETAQDFDYEMGGGGLFMTASDCLTFIALILNGGVHAGKRVLAPETVALMRQNALPDGVKVRRLHTAMPDISADAEFFPGLPKSHSLAFMLNDETAPTGRSAGSMAWAGIFNTFYWIDPRTRIGGLFFTQTLPFADPEILSLFTAFEQEAYRAG